MDAKDLQVLVQNAENAIKNANDTKLLDEAAHDLVDAYTDTRGSGDSRADCSTIVSTLERLSAAGALSDGWLTATLCCMKQDYEGYLKLIEPVIKCYLADGSIDFGKAYTNFLKIFYKNNFGAGEFISKFHRILTQNCPGSAFELYVRYLASISKSPVILKKYLEKVIREDSGWSTAYVDLGNICCNSKEWKEAAYNYNKAINGGLETAFVYTWLGWSYYNLQEWVKAEEAYRHCLELDAQYPYANNN
jgi:tetratricopeptide (TPR) repeat protein